MTKFQYNFYPRPPRGGRLGYQEAWADYRYISIHALREEGDSSRESFPEANARFLSRPPRGGRRPDLSRTARQQRISIHALREEGDNQIIQTSAANNDFYPRPPRGGRHTRSITTDTIPVFLSTPSARRATRRDTQRIPKHSFLSTPSARRATKTTLSCNSIWTISIHALREEGD